MTSIPLDTHPHILDAILDHAPYESLLVLRAASRELRDRIDPLFVGHIAFFGEDIRGAWKGRQIRIPRAEWWDVPAVADAVRLVDLCSGIVGGREIRKATGEMGRCWCGRKVEDPLATKLHCVQVVREWREMHWCAEITSPRRVFFLSDMKHNNVSQPTMAPTAVFHCAPGSLYCQGAGLGEVIIRAQPSDRNFLDAAILSYDLARPICLAKRVTLVGFEELPFFRAWAGDVDVREKIKGNVAVELISEYYVEEDEAPDILEQHLRFITDEEYRAETDEEVYALETYMQPPTVETWPQPRLLDDSETGKSDRDETR
ncbi:hypothetical protein CcaverHIS002_0307560 [Cutaneotrichosporon cavernicola]|uniref:Uncharacterized protein n=1 Tax=Cutaneotrichosporon cavernicola TaxID=279322 RepID=A0AA48ID18_9TREE|nr:uncharacterized protein CcaverHIS019_0307470 [Cutaneotrichosporon cavernicola]BEI82888.1 hypothetical protein CcaverHIS002_0307560 [Cutaneotrichosporon cavernicola]BEI90677.1 hypothetical protein CcaverHIS019_0307470 [Cutaneotrichosporon cavernicola]BEI98455.1 hypothetical protein CcaverHIS631_0307540 [Cutaneotrichosporon cavernicola]BEJ06228.1 hypothetical protein CcaverHIS641_0307500 [Cutaneotrichosporon cavernicola]